MFAVSARSATLKAAAPRSARTVQPARVAAPARRVAAKAQTEGTDEVSAKFQAYVKDTSEFLTKKWEETSDQEKPAAIALVVGAVVAQIAIGATVDAVDKLPFLSDVFELLGFAVIGVYGWKLATEPAERENLSSSVEAFVKSVTGK